MNFLDVILIILVLIIIIGGLAISIYAAIDEEWSFSFGAIITGVILIIVLTAGFGVIVIDKSSGSTVGEITSVDKNFFGTTAVYIKTSANAQEKYCVEDNELAEKAKELIGKKVKVSYGKRVGIYSTAKCDQAPLETIDEV